MRRRFLTAAGCLAVLVAGATAQAATPIPDAPARWVTDHAAFLSPAFAHELDARLGTFAARAGHQLLVYIDRTTGGDPIEDWGVRAFQHWRVGRKGIDDGLVLFIFSDDHRLRIEVGYGLEGNVPDALASRIINDRMVPLIRAGDRDGAVRSGVDALVAAIGAPPGTDPGVDVDVGVAAPAPPISKWKLVMGGLVLLLLIGFAITHPGLAWLMLMSMGSGRGGGGGFSGGGGGGGGGFSGGGGSSGGGGASGSW